MKVFLCEQAAVVVHGDGRDIHVVDAIEGLGAHVTLNRRQRLSERTEVLLAVGLSCSSKVSLPWLVLLVKRRPWKEYLGDGGSDKGVLVMKTFEAGTQFEAIEIVL